MPHLYELLAYIIAADLPSGMLIYPQSESEPTLLKVANIGRTIEISTIDIFRRAQGDFSLDRTDRRSRSGDG